jgi:CRISPR type I-E-associated protein CasB/Cse2
MPTNEIPVDFISRLKIRCKDNGAKARIKRSGGHSAGMSLAEGEMEIMRLRPPDRNDLFKIYHQVSIWYTLHPMDVRNKSFGKSLAELKTKMKSKTPEREILSIVRFNRKQMILHLPRLISLLASHKISIDYAGLIEDIKYWSKRYKTGSVQSRWIREYSKIECSETEKEKENEAC